MDEIEGLNSKTTEIIIYNLKYGLEHGNHSEFLERINEQQKSKDEDIERICKENSQIFLQYFKNFLLNKTLLTNFTNKVEAFNEKVYRVSLRNKFDSKEINNKREAIINIDKTIEIVNQIGEVVKLFIKSTDNLNKEKFMACIRVIAQIKKKPIFTNNQPANTIIRNIFNDVLPLIIFKIRKNSDAYLSQWLEYSSSKQQEYGQFIISNFEDDFKSGFNAKMTYIFNEMKGSMAKSDNKRTFYRESFIPNMRRTVIYASKNKNVELKTDFYLLFQCYQIYENINDNLIFFESLKNLRMKQLIDMCESELIISPKDMRDYVINILGFFVMEKEIMKQFSNYNILESLWVESLKKIEKNLSAVFERTQNTNDSLEIKNELHLLGYIIQKLGFKNQMIKILMIIKDNFIKYSEKTINSFQSILAEKIYNDNFNLYIADSIDEYEHYSKIFDFTGKNSDDFQFSFTEVIPEIVEYAINFINNCISYLKGVIDAEGLIHIQLDRFYFKLYEIIKQMVEKNLLTPIQLVITLQNIVALESSMKFLMNSIEDKLKILCTRDYDSIFYFQQIKINAEEMVQELIRKKIFEFLKNYLDIDWLPKLPNKAHNSFIQDLMDYLLDVYNSISIINSEMVSSIVYLSFKYINSVIMEMICNERIKKFNIISLLNLEKDLLFLFQICGNNLGQYENIMECLREVRQFLDLFLVCHPNDILDLNMRNNKFQRLNLKQMVIIFEKYKKIMVGKYPVVRRRHVRAVMDKLKIELEKMK